MGNTGALTVGTRVTQGNSGNVGNTDNSNMTQPLIF